MTRLAVSTLVAVLLVGPGCRTYRHGGALIGAEDRKDTPGTIGGVLQGQGGGDPIQGRRVEAVNAKTGVRYSAVTSVTGGFSIQIPPGDYRLQVELRDGEAVVKDPGPIHINMSDLDANLIVEVGPR